MEWTGGEPGRGRPRLPESGRPEQEAPQGRADRSEHAHHRGRPHPGLQALISQTTQAFQFHTLI